MPPAATTRRRSGTSISASPRASLDRFATELEEPGRRRIAVPRAVRPRGDAGRDPPLRDLPVRHGPARARLRRRVHGRMLRPVQARLLPALRGDHGRDHARPRRPDPDRPGLPARRLRCPDRPGDDPQQQRPRLGRGLLPGLRLGDLRPDRRRRGGAGAPAVRQPGGQLAAERRRPDHPARRPRPERGRPRQRPRRRASRSRVTRSVHRRDRPAGPHRRGRRLRRLAPGSARRDDRGPGVRRGDAAGRPVRVRPTTDRDGLRVRRGARG